MTGYKVRLIGSSVISPVNLDVSFMSEEYLVKWLQTTMPYYYPTFYRASVFEVIDNGHRFLMEFETKLAIVRKTP